MKTFITALVLAAGSFAAHAAEYTNFEIPASKLTRSEVRAAITMPDLYGYTNIGEATQFAQPARAVVAAPGKAEAMMAARPNTRSASFPSNVVPGRS
jgi:hydroxymethylglutaryl-CoA reductase